MGVRSPVDAGAPMDLPGVGPVVAARILADVGDVARFTDRNRFNRLFTIRGVVGV